MRKAMNVKKIFKNSISLLVIAMMLSTSISYFPVQIQAADFNVPTTQTGYDSLISYQMDKWNTILKKVFGATAQPITGGSSNQIPIPNAAVVKIQDTDENTYFKWKTDLDPSIIIPWDGQNNDPITPELDKESIVYPAQSVASGSEPATNLTAPEVTVEYTVYNVSNANELKAAMIKARQADGNINEPNNVKINLLNDIDLNGNEKTWNSSDSQPGYNNKGWLYIEGNDHTIYNMKTHSGQRVGAASFLGAVGDNGTFGDKCNKKVLIKNLNFSNCLVLSTQQCSSVVVGVNHGQLYMENVNVKNSFVYSNQAQTGTLIGRTEQYTGDTFLKNCSSQNCYVFGTDHSGGLTGCQHNKGFYQVKYDAPFPECPETWMAPEHIQNDSGVFPEMVENCYSVDSELYSLGAEGDSGGLLACGGKLICRNSFTNNTVYGNTRTGAFFGRIVTLQSGFSGLYDDNKSQTVEIYFENCYASGSVEGIEEIGGFVGFEATPSQSGEAKYGISIYKNCYTTAMVGMDYAGDMLGGFIGHEGTTERQNRAQIKDENENLINGSVTSSGTFKVNPGSVYINCYAAGEVGNILTDTSVKASGAQLGGFLGFVGGRMNRIITNGTYVNCYYDMQTTAMRERACGRPDQFAKKQAESSQIPGVTGVYTQSSEKKKVPGLTDTVDMGSAWIRLPNTNAYPMLKCFFDEAAQNFEGEKAETVRNYALASVSTVLLNHWDSVMNMDTGSLANENDWKPGVAANHMTKVSDGSEPWDDPTQNNGEHWEVTYKNLVASETPYEFKIQEGVSWSYNFGSDKFNGSNCKLLVNHDCNITIRFKYDGNADQNGENTIFEIWADAWKTDADGNKVPVNNFFTSDENGNLPDTPNASSIKLGCNANAVERKHLKVVGSFTDWNAEANSDSRYNLTYINDTQYAMTASFTPGDYAFKIVEGNGWSINYGADGLIDGTNMTFTVTKDCDVTFIYDEETHLTTVQADSSDALKDVVTKSEPFTFLGYSLIGPTAITGHEWLDGEQAAIDGEMTPTAADPTILSVDFTVKQEDCGKTYGYKVIKDGVDAGQNNYFHITNLPDGAESIKLTFTYNTATGVATVAANLLDCVEPPLISSYSVLGVKDLTGHNWSDPDDVGVPASEAGAMSKDASGRWTKTYTSVPTGTHSFKVVGNGTFDSGVSYGSNSGSGSGNYIFTLEQACSVTITFDEDEKHISVSTTPTSALKKEDVYVVSGTKNLTKTEVDWDTGSDSNKMVYDDSTDLYSKTYSDLKAETNYVFKVVKYQKDNKNENIGFALMALDENGDPIDYTNYQLVITYNARIKMTLYHLYDANGDLKDDYITSTLVDHYSVIGDEGLTGFNWMGEGNANQAEADAKGRMIRDKNGIHSVTFTDVIVNSNLTNLSFKVVANGDWGTGISYGNMSGDNYRIALSSEQYAKCNVTIKFDENTHDITVTSSPNCIIKVDESKFEWYVAGVYTLVSDDAYNAPKTVYDTVRDITANFSFTSGVTSDSQTFTWNIDANRNADSRFNDGKGFSLDYHVDKKDITGSFKVPIVALTSSIANGYVDYSCNNFMPGKQWLSVSTGTSNDAGTTGRRSLRLIPTVFLEAGNDADIHVLQSSSDIVGKYTQNNVTYRDNSLEGVTYTGLTNSNSKTIFDYYNFALGAGYAVTDRTGVGYYGNYSQQQIQTYDKGKIRPNKLDPSKAEEYFAMSSVFAESAAYDDETPLSVDTLVNQSLIGNSYNDGTNYAKTIVKIYKKVLDPNGQLDADGQKYSYPKVFMDSDESASAYHTNYLKWTGQQPFDVNDEGTYFVTYYWSLSDGRFRTDTKKVCIHSNLSEIDKKILIPETDPDDSSSFRDVPVNKSYIEQNPSAAEKNIKYVVTYTNRTQGDFTICDILPYQGDVRYDESEENFESHSNMVNASVTLKGIEVNTEFTDDSGVPTADCVSANAYYTKDQSVRNTCETKYTDDGKLILDDAVAEKVNIDGPQTWINVPSADPTVSDGEGATAIAVTGNQSASGTSKITITYTIEINSAKNKDCYLNNAFFTVKDNSSKVVNGCSNVVSTVVVDRSLSGYIWLDSNGNGKFETSEYPVSGVKVELYKAGILVDSAVSAEDGFYEFSDIYTSGGSYTDYKVQFSAPDGGLVTIEDPNKPQSIQFKDLYISRTLSEYPISDKIGSRNIAKADSANTEEDKKYYIEETLPSANQIFQHNNMNYLNGKIEEYHFSKPFQNLGISKVDIENKKCTLTVLKVEAGTSNPLHHVQFKLEYRITEDEAYRPVTYRIVDSAYAFDANGIEANAIDTGIDGEIRFTELPIAQYRLTEVATLEGYNLLPSSLEFNLPYYIGEDDSFVQGDSDPIDGVYYDITYTVENSTIPHLPLTGVVKNLLPLIIASVLMAVGMTLMVICRKKKKKS